MDAEPERFDVVVAGGTIAVWSYGAPLGSGSPVVLAVHGITGNHVAWEPVQRVIGDDITFIAPDLRGRGRSSNVRGPFGLAAHSTDQLAVLDHAEADRAVIVGHSMGAFVATQFAVEHADRVATLVLVDGGLAEPPPDGIDVQATLDAVLGPAIARLSRTFASPDEYHEFWFGHPAFGNGDVKDGDLVAYADHDLVGEPPALRSSVQEEAVRTDGADVLHSTETAHRLTVDTLLFRAPRGLLDEPTPLISFDLADAWVSERPEQRTAVEITDVNHYTIVMGRGAGPIAEAVSRYGSLS